MSATLAVPATLRTARAHVPVDTGWRWVAAAASTAAAVLHGVAAAQQVAGAPALAAAFVLTALAQLAAGAWLALGRRGSGWDTRLVGLVLTGTVVLVLLFVVAHATSWLPVLHGAAEEHAGHLGHAVETDGAVSLGLQAPAETHPADALGTGTVAVELLAVLGLTALLRERARRLALDLLLVTGLVLWSAWLTGLLG